ncbi:MAG TPA: (Fe-S)-binding protein, partial [Gammaproteobacteria bacterium]|nr:(Fe-S)-binding protein [Gammaproteobacteria bacterium]
FQAVLTTGRLRQRLLRGTLRLYQRSGLQSAVRPRLRGRLGRLEGMLPALPPARRLPESLPAPAGSHDWVGLFTGCTGDLFDADTLTAAARVLNRLGFGVRVPREQGCCGALDLAAGDAGAARDKARVNAAAFEPEALQAVIGVASGCTAALREAGEWADAIEGAGALAGRVEDIVAFLSRIEWPEGLTPAPLTGPVAIHEPCSLRNVLKAGGATARLLGRIPTFEPVPLPAGCCGAGGSHVLRHPEAADALRAETLEAVAESGARTLVSANIGCALHLAAGLRETGIDCEVLHPVTLLDRQLAAAGAYNQG